MLRVEVDAGARQLVHISGLFLYPPGMSDLSDLYVEVQVEEIIVALPHSTHKATYRKSADSAHLIMTDASSPEDPGSSLTPAEFLGLAEAANAKARELGWIV